MTAEVTTVRDDASYAEVAATLTTGRISAAPVVDRFDNVVGVVSWTDLHEKASIDGDRGDGRRVAWWRGKAGSQWPAGIARQVMSSPPVTIGPHRSLAAAGRVMFRRKIGRLLVVDGDGRLWGTVSRSDLLKVHGRLDAVIRDEVVERVLRRTLMIEPGTVDVAVDDGVVTLTGQTARQTTARAAALAIEGVAGVTEVVNRLRFDFDDAGQDDAAPDEARQGPMLADLP